MPSPLPSFPAAIPLGRFPIALRALPGHTIVTRLRQTKFLHPRLSSTQPYARIDRPRLGIGASLLQPVLVFECFGHVNNITIERAWKLSRPVARILPPGLWRIVQNYV